MEDPILSITAIAEVFPDGQKITAVVVEFDRKIDTEKLSPAPFSVKDRTVTRVYTNTVPSLAAHGKDGNFVILELSKDDEEAWVLSEPGPGHRGPVGPGIQRGPFPGIPLRVRKPLMLCLKQLYDITATDGTVLPAWKTELISNKASQPIVDDFQQYEYKCIQYNLFVPKDYDEKKLFPLVMFIADASANSDDPLLPLVQGSGGVIWAAPQEQAKHPCFVLVPQVPHGVHLTGDDFTASPELEIIKELLDDVLGHYSIDRNRIYATGQSQGCMASCELNIRYPDCFAASLLVSGQWKPKTMAEKLAKKSLFIALSEGGPKEFPGMNAVTEALEAAGANVARACLNTRKPKEELNIDVMDLIATGANILYAIYDAKTVLPDDGREYPQIAHHFRGWQITYEVKAIRDWLFSQEMRQS